MDHVERPHLTVFIARSIITMEPALPRATAVGVLDGIIAGVGTLEDLRPWMDAYDHTVDTSFADHVLMPGLIDPHLHPLLPAILTQMPFVAPDAWRLPGKDFPAVTTPADYLRTVRGFLTAHDFGSGPFFTWGYHPVFHGDLPREQIDTELAADRSVFLWHRSFHEIYANTVALKWAGFEDISDVPDIARDGVDLAAGRFSEGGLAAILPKLQPVFFAPDRLAAGMATFGDMVHRGGVTTVADMGTGIMGPVLAEAEGIRQAFERDDVPFRVQLTPLTTAYLQRGCTPQEAVAEVEAEVARGGSRVQMRRHAKLMIDGAFFSQGFQCCPPGYIDGHAGAWVVPPEQTEPFAQAFWDAGYQLHAHCNGDLGAQATLDLLDRLLLHKPRADHRFSLEHWGYSTEDQNRRLAALGAVVSGQPWYVTLLGEVYAEVGLGPDRAHQMCRFGSLAAKGVPVALHSDCPMAPLEPLRLAWAAASRRTVDGTVIGASEALTLDQALRAITTDAAWILRWENEIGSIRTGKKADFTVLADDPYAVGIDGLADLRVLGTVFEGRPAMLG